MNKRKKQDLIKFYSKNNIEVRFNNRNYWEHNVQYGQMKKKFEYLQSNNYDKLFLPTFFNTIKRNKKGQRIMYHTNFNHQNPIELCVEDFRFDLFQKIYPDPMYLDFEYNFVQELNEKEEEIMMGSFEIELDSILHEIQFMDIQSSISKN